METSDGYHNEFIKEHFELPTTGRIGQSFHLSFPKPEFQGSRIRIRKSIIICYCLYISPSSNIEKFNCPIPPEFHYSVELEDGRRVEVTTEKFYYSAFQLRRGLIFMIIITQSLLVIGALLLWKFVNLSAKS